MALYNVTQTEAGAAYIRNAILTTNSLTITHIAIGDGVLPDGSNPAARTQLVHEVKRIPVQSIHESGGAVLITARLATDSITSDIYQREVGLFSGETLVAYGNAGDQYDFLPAAGHNAAVVKLVSVRLVVGNLATTYSDIDSSDFVTFDALNTRLDTLIKELEDGDFIHVSSDAARMEHLRDYLFEAWYCQLDYGFAARYFDEKAQQQVSGGACSSIRAGGYFGRNLDWTFGEQPTIVVHTDAHAGRFATLGVCGAVTGLTDAMLLSGASCEQTRIIPFMLVDGVNEKGLCVSVNVVPHNDKGDNSEVLPAVQERMRLCTLMLPRFVLDNFATAQAAVEYLRDYVRLYHPATLIGMDYEQHFLICDSAHSYIVEFVDGELCILDASGNPYITNFHVSGVTFNADGGVVTPETQTSAETACTANGITEHGSGLERWNIIAARHATAGTAEGMRELLDTLMYTRSYETSSDPATPRWNTEFVGVRGLRADSPAEYFDDVQHDAGELYTERTRTDGNTWQTVHSSIYDMANGTLRLVVQEDTAHEYTFSMLSLTLDDLPTDGSHHAVTSDGVYKFTTMIAGVLLDEMQSFYDEFDAHRDSANEHMTQQQYGIVHGLETGKLWNPGQTGSVTLSGTNGTGCAISSANSMSRIEVRDTRAVITSPNVPQWIDSGGEPAIYEFVTTKDIDPLSLINRVEAIERGGVSSKGKYVVIGVWGQSNAVGYDESPLTLYDSESSPRVMQVCGDIGDERIETLGYCASNYQDMSTVDSRVTMDRSADAVADAMRTSKVCTKGLQLPLANLVLSVVPDGYGVIIVPCACGGQGVTAFKRGAQKPSASGTDGMTGNVYDTFISRMRFALDANAGNIFGGIIWCQGETDAQNSMQPATYWGHLSDIITAANADLQSYAKRSTRGSISEQDWYFFEWPVHYKDLNTGRAILAELKSHFGSRYVAIPDSTPHNTTLYTSSTAAAHFGQDSYRTVIAPRVFAAMVGNGAFLRCPANVLDDVADRATTDGLRADLNKSNTIISALIEKINELAALHPGDVDPVRILRTLTQEDLLVGSAYSTKKASFSVIGGTLSVTNNGGISVALLPADCTHFEADVTHGVLAIMLACKPGDTSGGAGVFLTKPGNNCRVFVCSTDNKDISNNSAVPGHSWVSDVTNAPMPAGHLTVDLIVTAPQAETGYTHKAIIRHTPNGGESITIIETYLEGGIGNLVEYTEPRIGIFGSWTSQSYGSPITLENCKIS